jgi:hypothetical protein
MARCEATTNKGTLCQNLAREGSTYCYMHSPEHAQARHRNAVKGGRIAGKGRPLLELRDTKEELLRLKNDVLEGTIDRADAICVNQLLNSYIRCITVELQVHEQLELRERIEALEEDVALRDENGYVA